MAFTLTTLKTAIQDYAQNSEDTFVAHLNTFIRLSEQKIDKALKIQNFNTKTVSGDIADTNTSVVVTDGATAPLSPLYFKIRSGDGTTTNAWSFLMLKDYNFLQEYAPIDSTSTGKGTPKYYAYYNNTVDATPSNASTFAFAPVSDGAYDYEILYFFNPPSLIDVTADTYTWLSRHGADALLYGCLMEAYIFMKGEADVLEMYKAQFVESLAILASMESDSYRSETYRSPGARVAPGQAGVQ